MDCGDGHVRVYVAVGPGNVQERAGRCGRAVADAVTAAERDASHAVLDHLLAQQAAARGGNAAEVDELRLLGIGGREKSGVVGLAAGAHTVATDDSAAESGERGNELVCEALAVGLGVIDDVSGLGTGDGVRDVGTGLALDVVSGRDAHVGDLVRVRRPESNCRGALGKTRVGVGRAALDQARGVGNGDLGLGDVRVERAHDGKDRGVGDKLADVRRAGLWIVLAVERVVLLADLDVKPGNRILGDGELDALEGRVAVRQFSAGERQLDADLDCLGSRRRAARGGRAARRRTARRCHEGNHGDDC